ncbi:ABC transporter ATP-binding protein [Jatrophihabitans cynanchi]|uniref:ABC transporter ATP-binding protein n=1 Tax=Jatrophihabitans cynanchi TaxID=2944128 RepID=A0ABY7K6Z2_9ACTN|nr:ABC transporter ATP-binding protein [Jatrophihabitans sp. SB3-54]WAX59282.1 ABC transporter ATP-binding protein [Jatrophihabitans sp. SB3-54]
MRPPTASPIVTKTGESPPSAPGAPVVLSANSLRVRYRNGALGILDVSVEVKVGQVVALFGPNGAGKTTTVRAISGFLRSEGARVIDGSVSLMGRATTNMEPSRTARIGLAFVPERKKVFASLSVRENLEALGQLPPRAERAAAFQRVYDMFPILWERRRSQAGRLSGGQQQMLAIARGLLTDPRLLIIDEMTLGLHHSLHEPLFDAVREVAAQGTSVLLVDESTGFALDVADHCYLLSAGRTRMSGPAEEFRGSELLAAGYVDAE